MTNLHCFKYLLLLFVLSFYACGQNEEPIVEVPDLEFTELRFSILYPDCEDGKEISMMQNGRINYQTLPNCGASILTANTDLTVLGNMLISDAFVESEVEAIDLDQCGVCNGEQEEKLILIDIQGNVHTILFDNRDYDELAEILDLLEELTKIRASF